MSWGERNALVDGIAVDKFFAPGVLCALEKQDVLVV